MDKDTIVFDKWESGDYDWNTGNEKEDNSRIRTPVIYKKKIEPSTKYRIIPSINVTFGLRTYKKEGTFISTFSSTNLTEGIFTSPSSVSYGLMMVITTNKNIKVKVQKIPILELGELDITTGKLKENSNKVRTANYIKVKPKTEYNIQVKNVSNAGAIRWLLYNNEDKLLNTWYFNVGEIATIDTKEATKLKLYLNGIDLDANILIEPTGNIFVKAELLQGIWISGNNINSSASGARCWIIPCKQNTTYSITRASNTHRGTIGSASTFPQIANGTLDKSSININSSNKAFYTTTENSKYLIIYFAVNTTEYDNVKWTITEVDAQTANEILEDNGEYTNDLQEQI